MKYIRKFETDKHNTDEDVFMSVIFKTKDKQTGKIAEIDVEYILPNPCQPRKVFSDSELIALAQSIKENGLLQPITVRKTEDNKYELIAGERRLRAAKLAGLEKIPAIITEKTLEESAVLAVLENIQRSDLNCFEQAGALSRLIEYYGFTQEQLAVRLGMAQSTVANKLRLLKLAESVREKAIEYNFNERQIRALLKLPEQLREKTADEIYKLGLNVTQTDDYIEKIMQPKEKKKKQIWLFKEKRLYINSINRTLEVMKKSGVPFDSTKKIENGYLEYVIRIPQDNI